MKLNVLKNEKTRLEIELVGETQTLTHMISKNAQKFGDSAAVQEHPFMSSPKIVISGTNPKKILEKAVIETKNQLDEFNKEFSRQV